jgi:hypothetical protein
VFESGVLIILCSRLDFVAFRHRSPGFDFSCQMRLGRLPENDKFCVGTRAK